jgi:hypothetical protein
MQIMSLSITTHIYLIYIFSSIMFFNLILVLILKDFIKLAKLLRFMTPLYHLINAMIIYTGIIIWVTMKSFDLTILFMIIGSIFLLVIEIKRYKKMRVITSKNIQGQKEFYSYAKKIYIIELFVIFTIYLISKIF